MYSELSTTTDQGANTISPFVASEEIPLTAFITFIECSGEKVFVGLGDGRVKSFSDNRDLKTAQKQSFQVRGLPICSAVKEAESTLIVGTDNSELLQMDEELETLVKLEKGWIEQIAVSASGLIAYAAGKTCYVLGGSKNLQEIALNEGTISGLQFSADGKILAIARYGGVVLWDTEKEEISVELEQQGAHLGLSMSPDAHYLVTATPDKEIHCWDLTTRNSFRMRGYPSKIRSFCWAADGQHLAAAGADSVTVWPFVNGNPSGKPPYEFGYSFQGTVTTVAAHPSEAVVAAGYNNGTVLIGKYLKGEAIIARTPTGETISAMNWSKDGESVYVGTETGKFSRIKVKDINF